MGKSDTYIWESINDVINIDEHIEFASKLIDKYSWDNREKEVLINQLSTIRSKQKDKCINLSVIGEFSSGKSSFINALLGEEILVSSAIQGTTVVNTIIDYSDHLFINILYKNNKTKYSEPSNKEELKQLLSKITTDGNNAKNISYVVVGIPSKILKNNIRIIDTPGTNSIESWHEEVTKRAISEVSDLSVILTDAIKPMPQSLMSFVEENLLPILGQCALAITRSDLVDGKDREDIKRYIERKIQNEFGVSGLLIIPFAAPALIGEMTGMKLVKCQSEMATMSKESTKLLLLNTAKKRQIAQIKKLLMLIDNVFDSLKANMHLLKHACDKDLEILRKSRNAQLEPFIRQQKTSITSLFCSHNKDLKLELEKQCDTQITIAKRKVRSSINGIEANIVDKIKAHMEGKFIDECKQEASNISSLATQMRPKQEKLFKQALKAFQTHFNEQFEKLGILKVEFDINSINAPATTSVSTSDIQGAINYISSELSNENWAYGGGALTGAAIGTAIAPGIGTVIGFLGGLFAGAAMAPNVEEVKKKVQSKVDGPLNSFLKKIKYDTLQSFDDSTDTISKAIEIEIDRYLKKYKRTINQRIEKNQEQQNRINLELNRIDVDLQLLETRKKQLHIAMTKLN